MRQSYLEPCRQVYKVIVLPFCPKCGASVPDGAVFCTKCGSQIAASTETVRTRYARDEKREKGEKDEKHEEKGEKHEKSADKTGAVVGGLVLIWLGISLYLVEVGYTTWSDWWPYLIIGIGVVLIAQAVLRYSTSQFKGSAIGPLIGGAVLIFIGFAGTVGMREWWPFVLIAIGVLVIAGGLTARMRTPRPR